MKNDIIEHFETFKKEELKKKYGTQYQFEFEKFKTNKQEYRKELNEYFDEVHPY